MRAEPPLRDRSDPDLWAAAGRDDPAAFEELFLRHHQAVWRHSWRVTASADLAEDVTSATFLTAWRRRGEVRLTHDSSLPWLMAVATNEARTHRRQGVRHERLARRVGPAPAAPDHADDVVATVDGDARQQRVLDAVDALPARYRDVVALHLLGGLSSADTARALGVAEATVRSRTARARTRVRALLQEDL